MSQWLGLIRGNVPVSVWVWLLSFIVAAAVASYFLYRLMLAPAVEHGEWHPANLRRAMWSLFVVVSCAGAAVLLRSYLQTTAYILLLVLVLIVIVLSVLSRKRV